MTFRGPHPKKPYRRKMKKDYYGGDGGYQWLVDDETDHGPAPKFGSGPLPTHTDTSPPYVLAPEERPDWYDQGSIPTNPIFATEWDPDWGNQRSGGGRPGGSKGKKKTQGRKKTRTKRNAGLRIGMKRP